ncbi:MAG: ribokinase [Pseudomonadota bacterium]
MSRVVVLGSVNIDYVLHLPRFPQPGETLAGSEFRVTMGGKGANQAVACARAGGDCALVACIGDDAYGREALAGFEADGIDVSGVTVLSDARTGAALIFIDDQGENCIGISAEANAALAIERVEAASMQIAAADWLLMQLEVPLPAVQRAVEIAKAAGTRVALNPAPAAGPLPSALLQQVDLLTPNQTEARTLLPDSVQTDEAAARALLALGVGTVIVTQGAAGALLVEPAGTTPVPGIAARVVDTVGAGDCFNGVLVAELARGATLPEAMAFATRAAAIAVTREGAQTSMPLRSEIAGA